MLKFRCARWTTLTLVTLFFVASGSDCPMEGDTGMPGGGSGGGSTAPTLTVVETTIAVHVSARIEAGDGIIAYGTGAFSGVDYIKSGDTAGRGITNGVNFRANSFAVAGTKIALSENFQVTVFDTSDGSSPTIATTDVRIERTPVDAQEPGHLQADGNLIATLNDPSIVTDGKRIKVIDVSTATPSVISFDTNPATAPSQLSVDASNPHVAVVAGDIFYIYDVDAPATAPTQFDMTAEGGIGDTQIQFQGGYVLFHDDSTTKITKLLKVSDGTVVTMTENPSAQNLGLNGGTYCYFVRRSDDDDIGTVNRSAIGIVPSGAALLAGDVINSGNSNNGFVGWGQTTDITPNGGLIFVAGTESIGQQEFLMVSAGGAFSLVADAGDTTGGHQAADVSASANLVGFKIGSNNDTFLGYIVLP